MMTASARYSHLMALDEELLKGGVMLSEWCSIIVRETDCAFVSGAHLATIVTAVAGIETYLRSAYPEESHSRLIDLIDSSLLSDDLKAGLHKLRRYRNGWVHLDAPHNDDMITQSTKSLEAELEFMAFFAARALRKTIYSEQCA